MSCITNGSRRDASIRGYFFVRGQGFLSMRWSELVLLMEGISPKVGRRHRYGRR